MSNNDVHAINSTFAGERAAWMLAKTLHPSAGAEQLRAVWLEVAEAANKAAEKNLEHPGDKAS